MKLMISGHRYYKLVLYDTGYIKLAIEDILNRERAQHHVIGLSGMASGVDLWFCQICRNLNIDFIACVPFPEQRNLMHDAEEGILRDAMLNYAREVKSIRNSAMVEMADRGIIVWDGNKGGTHNVVQQLVENKKGFYWINPVSEKVFECL